VFNGIDFIMRTTGYTSLEECDAMCGMELLTKAAQMNSIAHISLAIGTKDCWQPYYLAQTYHDGAVYNGLHIRSYFQLGGGHEANIKEIMNDLVYFTAALAAGKTPAEAAEQFPPGKYYYVFKNPDFRVYMGIRQINVDSNCIPVSVRFPKRMVKGHSSMIEIVGHETRRVRVSLADSNGTALIAIDTIMPWYDHVLYPFTVEETGNYTWTVIADENDTLTFTPFNNIPLVLEVRDKVTNYNVTDNAYYDRGFGVDEVKDTGAVYNCPDAAARDIIDIIHNDRIPPLTAQMLPGNVLFVRSLHESVGKLTAVSLYTAGGRRIGRYGEFKVWRSGGAWNVLVDLGTAPAPGSYMLRLETPGAAYRSKVGCIR
jgi:hypothetical protein